MKTFIVLSTAGDRRDLSKGSREQALWDEHADFIDGLVDEGFILMGGPLVDEGGAMVVVRADDEETVRAKMVPDPWYKERILALISIKRWDVFIDRR